MKEEKTERDQPWKWNGKVFKPHIADVSLNPTGRLAACIGDVNCGEVLHERVAVVFAQSEVVLKERIHMIEAAPFLFGFAVCVRQFLQTGAPGCSRAGLLRYAEKVIAIAKTGKEA